MVCDILDVCLTQYNVLRTICHKHQHHTSPRPFPPPESPLPRRQRDALFDVRWLLIFVTSFSLQQSLPFIIIIPFCVNRTTLCLMLGHKKNIVPKRIYTFVLDAQPSSTAHAFAYALLHTKSIYGWFYCGFGFSQRTTQQSFERT